MESSLRATTTLCFLYCPSDIQLSNIARLLLTLHSEAVDRRRHSSVNLTADFRLLRNVAGLMVGLGRLELPTSPLSGVRSSHLSYRPVFVPPSTGRPAVPGDLPAAETGGAGRDRTGDLLNANQALSQLSYSPLNPSSSRTSRGNRGRLDTGARSL